MLLKIGHAVINTDQIVGIGIWPEAIKVCMTNSEFSLDLPGGGSAGKAARWWLETEQGQLWYRRCVSHQVVDLVEAHRAEAAKYAGREAVVTS